MRHFRPGRVVLIVAVAVAAVAVGIHVSRPTQSASPGNLKGVPPGPHSPLDKRSAMVRIDPQPLGEIIERLEKLYATRIEVDWEGIERVGLPLRPESNVLVELWLGQVTLRQVLAKVLQSLHDGSDLAVTVVGDAVRIGPKHEADPTAGVPQKVVVRLYDVRDVLAMMEFEQRTGVSFEPFVWDGPASPPGSPPEDLPKILKQMVVDTIAPESWRDAGGTDGSIESAGGRLMIVQTPEVHEEVVKALDDLRDSLHAPYHRGGAVAAPKP